jgi:hypothetical protein
MSLTGDVSGGVGEQVAPHLVVGVVSVESRCGEHAVLTADEDLLAEGRGLTGEPVPTHAFGVVGLAVRAVLEHRGDGGHLTGRTGRFFLGSRLLLRHLGEVDGCVGDESGVRACQSDQLLIADLGCRVGRRGDDPGDETNQDDGTREGNQVPSVGLANGGSRPCLDVRPGRIQVFGVKLTRRG